MFKSIIISTCCSLCFWDAITFFFLSTLLADGAQEGKTDIKLGAAWMLQSETDQCINCGVRAQLTKDHVCSAEVAATEKELPVSELLQRANRDLSKLLMPLRQTYSSTLSSGCPTFKIFTFPTWEKNFTSTHARPLDVKRKVIYNMLCIHTQPLTSMNPPWSEATSPSSLRLTETLTLALQEAASGWKTLTAKSTSPTTLLTTTVRLHPPTCLLTHI